MAYTPTVEFVWLPAATSPGPTLTSKNPGRESGSARLLCHILSRGRARREVRTKSELSLARLRRSWHIRLQWNSYGCRRRLRAARPCPLKIQLVPKRPTPSPLFTAPAALAPVRHVLRRLR